MSTAADILRKGAQHIEDRATMRDQPQGERSMARTVGAFNALTGHDLSERDGWLFMVALKAARACATSTGVADDYEDLAAYAALAGESVAEAGTSATAAADPMANTWTHPSCPAPISFRYAFAAQDADGEWWAYARRPHKMTTMWVSDGTEWVRDDGETSICKAAPNPNWHNTLICRDEVQA